MFLWPPAGHKFLVTIYEAVIPMSEKEFKKGRRQGDPVLTLLAVQAAVCALLLVAAVAVKAIGGDLYSHCRAVYVADFEDVTDAGEVLDLLEGEAEDTATSSQVAVSAEVEDQPDEQDESTYEFDLSQVQQLASVRLNANKMCRPYSVGRITSEFGYRVNPVNGVYRLHGGVDIGLNHGDDIYAALAGTVTKSTQSSDYGKFIVIDHGAGLQTLYAHCSKLLVEEGDSVKKGQLIALAGSTGVSTGPHLHFEVRVNGTRVDPLVLLPEVGEA